MMYQLQFYARYDDMSTSGSMAYVTTAPHWLAVDEQRVWRAYLDMHARLGAQLNREMQDESGLSSADFSVLVELSEHPDDRMRVLELARELRWEKSRLSHQLTRMQQRGLVDRSSCSEDRRGAWIVLTSEGRAAVEAAAPRHVESVRKYLFDELDAQQVEALGVIAQTVIARLDRECGSREPDCNGGEETCG
jgi:DNA-binding MarR family transcriptional regulator